MTATRDGADRSGGCAMSRGVDQDGRTRRVLVGASVGALPGLLLLGAAFAIETWVESGGGLGFGIVGMLLLVVGAPLGVVMATGGLDTPTDPRVGALVGAVPGLLMLMLFRNVALVLAVVGAVAGYLIVAGARARGR